MTSELDALLETVGKRGFLFHAFRANRHGPELLAAIRDLGRCADVVILIDEDHAHAYRTPTGPGIDPFAPTYAYWSYAANPVWTLRALLTLAPPGHPDAPSHLTGVPTQLSIPTQARLPATVRKRG